MSDAPVFQAPTIQVRSPRPHAALVVLAGEHDLHSADEVRQTFDQALADCDHLIVDLSAAEFIDSTIVHLLLQTKKNAIELDRKFNVVLGTAPVVERILKITGVVLLLNVVPTVERALAAQHRGNIVRVSARPPVRELLLQGRDTLAAIVRARVQALVAELVNAELAGRENGHHSPPVATRTTPDTSGKVCSVCHETKPVSAFERNRGQCRSCRYRREQARKAEEHAAAPLGGAASTDSPEGSPASSSGG